ncbi:Hpt domain-containing protein [Lutibacter sp. HS1-25]|uniref:Hpt domain-containing protein n=1 Tax=Lutibacter sp. HS1-25 TaxID=2485000 RepID=UPI0010116F29|nr:Hpt domain-containing protein [Lutibacter sp. HS1-25]RXP45153.1 Hpt domain-containing protein [Lutibacter sp. HS1-25]
MQIPLYDLRKLEEIAKGNKQFVDKMIQLFIDETPKSVAELKSAYENGDYEKVKSIAHRIKPSIEILGIAVLKDEINVIKAHIAELKSSDHIGKWTFKLDTLVNDVVASLKNRE